MGQYEDDVFEDKKMKGRTDYISDSDTCVVQ